MLPAVEVAAYGTEHVFASVLKVVVDFDEVVVAEVRYHSSTMTFCLSNVCLLVGAPFRLPVKPNHKIWSKHSPIKSANMEHQFKWHHKFSFLRQTIKLDITGNNTTHATFSTAQRPKN